MAEEAKDGQQAKHYQCKQQASHIPGISAAVVPVPAIGYPAIELMGKT